MKLRRRKWLFLSLIIVACLVWLGHVGLKALDRYDREMIESKLVRTSPGTVVRKSEGKVYYRIDNFENLPESRRSRAMEAENSRLQKSGPRWAYSAGSLEHVDVGSTVYVHFQCFSNGNLEIVRVDTEP